jgi:hypothetical protein
VAIHRCAGSAPAGQRGSIATRDTALKAYFQTRSRYLAGLPQQRAFNQIGEALPCVIVDGLVAGTWSWNTRTANIDEDAFRAKEARNESRVWV